MSLIHNNTKTNAKYECNTCGAILNSSDALRQHTSEIETTLLWVFFVILVNKLLLLTIFLEDVHEKKQTHECTVCYKVLANLRSMQRHTLTHSGEKRKWNYKIYPKHVYINK